MRQTHQLLDYIATQEDTVITYTSSHMKLSVQSDASYLRKPKSRRRASGHLFLSNEAAIPEQNGAILNIAHIIKHVMCEQESSSDNTTRIYTRKMLVMMEITIYNFYTSFIPAIQRLAFHLPHVRILGTNHCGAIQHTAFK